MNKLLICFGVIFYGWHTQAQEPSKDASSPVTVQPTIMVIPFAPSGVSLRNTYESNELMRIAITKVKEAFDQRGVNTIDFRAKLKQLDNNDILTEDQQRTMKDEVIQMSGADIYVEVEANKNASNTGNSVDVIMSAYDAFSGESLANKVSSSPKFYTDNYEKLVEKAVEAETDNLLNTIQEKFNDIIENGRTVVLQVGIGEEAPFDLDSEIGDKGSLLSELIEDWVQKNAYKNYYHLQGSTATRMIFDIVKIPLKDENEKNYRLSKFAAGLRNYLEGLGMEVERTINGNNLILTLKEPS